MKRHRSIAEGGDLDSRTAVTAGVEGPQAERGRRHVVVQASGLVVLTALAAAAIGQGAGRSAPATPRRRPAPCTSGPASRPGWCPAPSAGFRIRRSGPGCARSRPDRPACGRRTCPAAWRRPVEQRERLGVRQLLLRPRLGLGALAHGQGLVQVHPADVAGQVGDGPAGTARHRLAKARRHDGPQAGEAGREAVEEPGLSMPDSSAHAHGSFSPSGGRHHAISNASATGSETIQTNPGVSPAGVPATQRTFLVSTPEGPPPPVTAPRRA